MRTCVCICHVLVRVRMCVFSCVRADLCACVCILQRAFRRSHFTCVIGFAASERISSEARQDRLKREEEEEEEGVSERI